MTYQHDQKRKPIVPEEKNQLSDDPYKRMEQLRRRPRQTREENWS
jgi:hypothetical protein